MSSDLYYTKYLKYKAKYIQLKFNQSGGGPTWMRFASYMADADADADKNYAKAKSQFENTPAFQSLEKGLKHMMNTEIIEDCNYDMDKLKKLINGDKKSSTEMQDQHMKLPEEQQFAHFTPEIKKIMKWAYKKYLDLDEKAIKKAEEYAASI
jgi:hypothetical protein